MLGLLLAAQPALSDKRLGFPFGWALMWLKNFRLWLETCIQRFQDSQALPGPPAWPGLLDIDYLLT